MATEVESRVDRDVRKLSPTSHVTITALIDVFAGTVGGIACVLASQPLDTVKVKLQTYPEQYSRGMVECFARTFQQGGVRGLYAGTVPNLAAQIAENATLFMFYGLSQKVSLACWRTEPAREISWHNFLKICGLSAKQQVLQRISGREGEVSFLAKASSGSIAAFFVSFVLTPTELVKCQLQAVRETRLAAAQGMNAGIGVHGKVATSIPEFSAPNSGKMPTAFSITRFIWKREGMRGLFRGLDSTLAREVPGYFFFFAGYEGSKYFLINRPRQKPYAEHAAEGKGGEIASATGVPSLGPVWFRTMVSGAVAGLLFWTVMFPVDVVKSRIQTGRSQSSFVGCFRDILKQEGPAALYNGLSSGLLRTIPASAVLFLAYEFTKKHMSKWLL